VLTLDDMATHAAHIIGRMSREGHATMEPKKATEDTYCDTIFAASGRGQRFLAACTPGCVCPRRPSLVLLCIHPSQSIPSQVSCRKWSRGKYSRSPLHNGCTLHCPLRYYNSEGNVKMGKSLRGAYPGGPLKFFKILRDSREDGTALREMDLCGPTAIAAPSSL
jgi:hypothetical protein